MEPMFTDPASQPVLGFLGAPERLLVSGPQAGGEFALVESTAHRGHTAPLHRHLLAAETFIVLDGELVVEVGGERRTAGKGFVAVLPKDLPHTFLVVSETARYMTLHTPAGFDDFMREVSASPGIDRIALIEMARRHGIEILGPGLSLEAVEGVP